MFSCTLLCPVMSWLVKCISGDFFAPGTNHTRLERKRTRVVEPTWTSAVWESWAEFPPHLTVQFLNKLLDGLRVHLIQLQNFPVKGLFHCISHRKIPCLRNSSRGMGIVSGSPKDRFSTFCRLILGSRHKKKFICSVILGELEYSRIS